MVEVPRQRNVCGQYDRRDESQRFVQPARMVARESARNPARRLLAHVGQDYVCTLPEPNVCYWVLHAGARSIQFRMNLLHVL
jgi:hypothetical protein